MAFSPDGRRLATGGGKLIQSAGIRPQSSEIRLWNAADGASLGTLAGHGNIITSLAFIDQRLLASGSWDYSFRIWDSLRHELIAQLPMLGVGSMVLDPRRPRLAFGALKGWIGFLDLLPVTRKSFAEEMETAVKTLGLNVAGSEVVPESIALNLYSNAVPPARPAPPATAVSLRDRLPLPRLSAQVQMSR